MHIFDYGFSSNPKTGSNSLWDLITKYFKNEYSNVRFINTHLIKQDPKIDSSEKFLTWLILMLNEE